MATDVHAPSMALIDDGKSPGLEGLHAQPVEQISLIT